MLERSINAFSSVGSATAQVIEPNPVNLILDASINACSSNGSADLGEKRQLIAGIEPSINAFYAIGVASRTMLLRLGRSINAYSAGGEADMFILKYPLLVRPTHAVAYYNRETFTMKKGDTLPWLDVQLLNVDRTPIDLSDADRVIMRMEHEELEIPVVDAPVQIVDPKQGRVRYRWKRGDTDLIGKHNIEFVLFYNGGADTVTVPSNRYLELFITREVIRGNPDDDPVDNDDDWESEITVLIEQFGAAMIQKDGDTMKRIVASTITISTDAPGSVPSVFSRDEFAYLLEIGNSVWRRYDTTNIQIIQYTDTEVIAVGDHVSEIVQEEVNLVRREKGNMEYTIIRENGEWRISELFLRNYSEEEFEI